MRSDQNTSLLGLFVVATLCIAVAFCVFYMFFQPQENSSETIDQQNRWSYTRHTGTELLMASYPNKKFNDPVAKRQSHHIQRHIAHCAAYALLTGPYPNDILRADAQDLLSRPQPWDEPTRQRVVVAAKQFEPYCASQLLDQFLTDGKMGGKVAQAIKYSGVNVDSSFEALPDKWPSGLDEPSSSRALARVVGL